MTNKRLEIENIVNNHPILNKVSAYLSEKHNLSEKEIHNKLIDFLVRESNFVDNNKIVGISCFVYDNSKNDFVNKTIYCNFSP